MQERVASVTTRRNSKYRARLEQALETEGLLGNERARIVMEEWNKRNVPGPYVLGTTKIHEMELEEKEDGTLVLNVWLGNRSNSLEPSYIIINPPLIRVDDAGVHCEDPLGAVAQGISVLQGSEVERG